MEPSALFKESTYIVNTYSILSLLTVELSIQTRSALKSKMKSINETVGRRGWNELVQFTRVERFIFLIKASHIAWIIPIRIKCNTGRYVCE